MKVLINSLIALLLLGDSVLAKPKPTPSPTAKKAELVCRTKQQDLELRDWITGIMSEAQKAKGEATAALKSNAETQTKLDQSIRAGQDLANECAADKKCAEAPLSCWFHRMMKRLLFGGLILAVGALALFIFAPGVISAIGSALSLIGSVISRILEAIRNFFKPKPPIP